MESELFDMLADTLTYEPPSGTFTDRGQPTYGAAVTYPCRIEPVQGEEIVRGPSGEERQAKWKIFIGTTTTLSPEGRLTLPSGFDPQQPPFYSLGRMADETAAHHQVATV